MSTIRLVKNDTAPRLSLTLTQDGSPIDLTGATVRLKLRKQGATSNVFSRTCTIADAVAGRCYYDWQSGDLANKGSYRGEIEITFSDGKVQTCEDLLKFLIRDEL